MELIDVETLRTWLEEGRPVTILDVRPTDQRVETLLQRLPPTPPNYERIVTLNEAGLVPEGNVTELEAGANRCAIS